ncbi:hypothetical protein BP6252_08962 [Coleophoma cylindrospora]|uniref:DUF6594 domain-containing protein n=1 Tax=Coleophoma cylindrospora TaxID=1849047 RepID=A0A3D8R0K6_9HELO|nr:hypothetical protein BP6252_08962 [Coleophoma cylindrospora]
MSSTTNSSDGRDNIEKKVPGWPQVAKNISEEPCFEAFEAFKDLHIKSLLYYQAEIFYMRDRLHELEWDDNEKNGDGDDATARCLDIFFRSGDSPDQDGDTAKRQIRSMREIRKVLKEYDEALLCYSQISELPAANRYNVNTLHECIKTHWREENPSLDCRSVNAWDTGKKVGNTPKSLCGHLQQLFWPEKEGKKLNLVVPRKECKVDGLTLWIANHFIPFWHGICNQWLREPYRKTSDAQRPTINSTFSKVGQSMCSILPCNRCRKPTKSNNKKTGTEPNDLLTKYTESGMLRFTSWVATIVACLLPIMAISVLSKLGSQDELLGVIAAFTAAFAMGLMCLTNASTSRVEIFTATAAFSAVMVVFVQNNSSQACTAACTASNSTSAVT